MNLLLNAALGALALLFLVKAVTASRRARRAERQLTWAINRSNHYFTEAAAARRQAIQGHADLDRAALAAELDQWLDDLLRRKER